MTADGIDEWIWGNDTGLSSRYLVEQLTGHRALTDGWQRHVQYPHDPADFGRCERLLRRFPVLRLRMGELTHPVWVAFVAHWDEIVQTIEAEVPRAFEDRRAEGRAPRGYALMRSVIDGTFEEIA